MENKLNYYFNFDMYAKATNFYFKNHDRVNTIFGTDIRYLINHPKLYFYLRYQNQNQKKYFYI